MVKSIRRNMRQDALLTELVDSITAGRQLENFPQIYLLRDHLVAKKYNNKAEAISDYETGRFLFNKGISIPKMRNLIEPNQMLPVIREMELKEKNFQNYFLIMNRIDGEMLGYLRGEERKKAEELFATEVKKVLALDIIPYDCFYGENSLYSQEEKKVFLIDFSFWERCSPRAKEKKKFLNTLKAEGNIVQDLPDMGYLGSIVR